MWVYSKDVVLSKTEIPGGRERRGEPRRNTVSFLVKVSCVCDHVYGFSKDISRTGMKLRTFTTCFPNPTGVGEEVLLEFRLPKDGSEVRCSAQVVWSMMHPGGQFTSAIQGLRFSDLDHSLADEISAWVNCGI
jgi:PilZ domain